MNDDKKREIKVALSAADAATQLRVAELIRLYPDGTPNDVTRPVGKSAIGHAECYCEALRMQNYADYLVTLAWFYAEARPTNAMAMLINAKETVVPNGKPTAELWTVLESLVPA